MLANSIKLMKLFVIAGFGDVIIEKENVYVIASYSTTSSSDVQFEVNQIKSDVQRFRIFVFCCFVLLDYHFFFLLGICVT